MKWKLKENLEELRVDKMERGKLSLEEAQKLNLVEKTERGLKWKNPDGSFTERIYFEPLSSNSDPIADIEDAYCQGIGTASTLSEAWSIARNASTGDVSSRADFLLCGVTFYRLYKDKYGVEIFRANLPFDTSGLGNVYVQKATLTINLTEIHHDPLKERQLYFGPSVVGRTLEASDYPKMLTGGFYTFPEPTKTGKFSVEVDRQWIRTNDWTILTFVHWRDLSDSPHLPSLEVGQYQKLFLRWTAADSDEVLLRPALDIAYMSIPAVPEYPFVHWATVSYDNPDLNIRRDTTSIIREGTDPLRSVFGINLSFDREVEITAARVRVMVKMVEDSNKFILEQLKGVFDETTVTWNNLPEVWKDWFREAEPVIEDFISFDVLERIENKDDKRTVGGTDWCFWGVLRNLTANWAYVYNTRQPEGYEWRKPHLEITYRYLTKTTLDKPTFDTVELDQAFSLTGKLTYLDGTALTAEDETGVMIEIIDRLGEKEKRHPATLLEGTGGDFIANIKYTDEEDLGTHKLKAYFKGTTTLAPSESIEEYDIQVVKKPTDLTFYVTDKYPVPGAAVDFTGCLLPKIGGLADQKVYLYLDGAEWKHTFTDLVGNFKFEKIGFFGHKESHLFDIYFPGTEEYNPIYTAETTQTITVTWQREVPVLILYGASPVAFKNYEFLFAGKIMSYHGAYEGDLTIELKKIDGAVRTVIDSTKTDEEGNFTLKWTPDSIGTFTFRAEFDGNYQLEPTVSADLEVKVIEKPDYFKPKWLVRILARDGTVLYGDLGYIESLEVSSSARAEMDRASLVLDNERDRFADIVAGCRLMIFIGYEPLADEDLPCQFIGMIEEVTKEVTPRGEKLKIKASDFSRVLYNRVIDVKYRNKSPQDLLTGAGNIFEVAELTIDTSEVFAPTHPKISDWTFSNRNLMDILKIIRDRSAELEDKDYEFYVTIEHPLDIPKLIFRPVLELKKSPERLIIGKNVSSFSFDEDEASVKTRVKAVGTKVEVTKVQTETVMTTIAPTIYLKFTPVKEVNSVEVKGITKTEDIDYSVDYEAGMVSFKESYPIGTEIKITYTTLERLEGDWQDAPLDLMETYGRKEMVVRTDLSDKTELNSLAKSILRLYQTPLKTAMIKSIGLPYTSVGQRIIIEDTRVNKTFEYVVTEIKHSITKSKGYVSSLKLTEDRPISKAELSDYLNIAIEAVEDYSYSLGRA